MEGEQNINITTYIHVCIYLFYRTVLWSMPIKIRESTVINYYYCVSHYRYLFAYRKRCVYRGKGHVWKYTSDIGIEKIKFDYDERTQVRQKYLKLA